jgi:hypothetical protein
MLLSELFSCVKYGPVATVALLTREGDGAAAGICGLVGDQVCVLEMEENANEEKIFLIVKNANGTYGALIGGKKLFIQEGKVWAGEEPVPEGAEAAFIIELVGNDSGLILRPASYPSSCVGVDAEGKMPLVRQTESSFVFSVSDTTPAIPLNVIVSPPDGVLSLVQMAVDSHDFHCSIGSDPIDISVPYSGITFVRLQDKVIGVFENQGEVFFTSTDHSFSGPLGAPHLPAPEVLHPAGTAPSTFGQPRLMFSVVSLLLLPFLLADLP